MRTLLPQPLVAFTVSVVLATLAVPLLASNDGPGGRSRPNVLFIAVDDLRPELGCYGARGVKSPQIDRLASGGMIFERAYAQQAICMSSRASLMSGLRPDHGEMWRNRALFSHVPDALTLNQHFLDHGYETIGLGKIYHHDSDNAKGWSRVVSRLRGDWKGRGYLDPESIRLVDERDASPTRDNRTGIGPAHEAADVEDSAYPDGTLAALAIEELRRPRERPFFLAVGFSKPHLPFNAPKRYWDLYDRESIPLAAAGSYPEGAPSLAATDWNEMRGYMGIPAEGPVPAEMARTLIHGYLACISYVDAQIGKLLDELDRQGLADNTIVVLWGDHGFKLGDLGMWAKHTNFERDLRVPLIVRAPGMAAVGGKSMALVELLDLFPTLTELAGLPTPGHVEGRSLAPLLQAPEQPWSTAAFSQYPRGERMGRTMRTARHRYTEWREPNGTLIARELYDLVEDPDGRVNRADDPAEAELVAELAEALARGPRA